METDSIVHGTFQLFFAFIVFNKILSILISFLLFLCWENES